MTVPIDQRCWKIFSHENVLHDFPHNIFDCSNNPLALTGNYTYKYMNIQYSKNFRETRTKEIIIRSDPMQDIIPE